MAIIGISVVVVIGVLYLFALALCLAAQRGDQTPAKPRTTHGTSPAA